jgi:3-isopropylmalate/(R)-2-methylmalate dehydratase large subunit
MGSDGSIPMALDYLEQMRPGATPFAPRRLVFALDHYGPASGSKPQRLQQRAREYAQAHGIELIEVGQGIGHQCILESGAARPGRLMVGADSHSTSYGAANAFATGIGSSDLAGIMLCGQLWLKVPESVRIRLTGRLAPGVAAKDIALTLARRMGADGANYRALEFHGDGIATLDMDDRIVLSNMSVELGAKAGIFPCDDVTRRWLRSLPGAKDDVQAVDAGVALAQPSPIPVQAADTQAVDKHAVDTQAVQADADARYAASFELDLATVLPQLALPHRVDNVVDFDDAPATQVGMVYLGTCTGGRVKDYAEALEELQRRGGVAQGVRLIVTPASETVRMELERTGMLRTFVELGAEIQPPGCGSCCGTCGTVPVDGQNVVSTANRNFKGRMGNGAAAIFLASPRSCGAVAATGFLGLAGDGAQR